MTITPQTSSVIEVLHFERFRRTVHTVVSQYLADRRERLTDIQIGKLSEREWRDLGLLRQDGDFKLNQSSRP